MVEERPARLVGVEPDGRRARRTQTEAELILAVGRLLRSGGVRALGVNSLAAEAGVDKALIYRYFGDLAGLVAAYAASAEFWPTVDEMLGRGRHLARDPDRPRAVAKILVNYARALQKRPLTVELLGWELSQHSEIVAAMQSVREETAREVFRELEAGGFPPVAGVAELGALLSAAMNYLVLRARHLTVFAGLPIRTSADWRHIEQTIELTVRGLVALARAPATGPTAERARSVRAKKR
jgi:AcrR family transcriptional regulator